MAKAQPVLTVLSENQISQVQRTAFSILEKKGIRVDDANARQLFAKAVGREDDNHCIAISGELVEWLIKSAPAAVDIFCRDKQPAFSLGSLPASFNMRTMESYCSPQSMLVNLACAEMMAHYGVPHCGTSGGWIGWGPDLLAGSMLWANHLTGVLGKVGLVPFVGNNFD